jgi:hypothetical protein
MKISFILGAAVICGMTFMSSASAQFADKRSFLHPLGVWSNEGYVAQHQVYPRFRYATDPYFASPSDGGWLLHERNR